MAETFTADFVQIGTFFTIGQVTLLLAFAAFLFALRPRSIAKTALALFYGLYAAGSLGGVLGWTFSPDDFTPALLAYFDFIAVGSLAFIGFAWTWPRPPRLASAPGVLLVAATIVQAAYVLAFFFARDAYMSTSYALTAGAWIRSLAFGLAGIALVLRLGDLPAAERRWGSFVAFSVVGSVLHFPLAAIVRGLVSLASGGAYFPAEDAGAVNTLPRWDHLVTTYVVAPALAIVWWRRERFPLVFAGLAYGALIAAQSFTPAAGLGTVMILQAVALAYAITHGQVLGVTAPPRRATVTLALVAGAAVFMIFFSVVLTAFGAHALVLGSGVVGGLVLGALTAWVTLPPDAIPIVERAEDSTRRLAAYTVALDRELRQGRTPDEARHALADLRAALRVSEDEHATVAGSRLPDDGLVLGRYRPLRILGEGGSGVTRLCRDERVARDVVLKTLREGEAGSERIDALLREARAIGAIKHANVITLHDVVQSGREAVIVMEHAERGSLRDAIAAGPLPPGEWRRVADGVLRALEAVHAAGVVHRDVKPSNVLLDASGEPKLADFGIARVPGFETTVGGLREGAVGTFRYMSPEHAKGRPATLRSDLFSAAATLYEARVGKQYLDVRAGESAVEVQWRAASAGPFERDVQPPALRAWFARALAPDPSDRFASAREMREALENT